MNDEQNDTNPAASAEEAPDAQVSVVVEGNLETFKKRFEFVAKRLPAGVNADADTYGQLLNMNRHARRGMISDLKRKLRKK